MRKAFLGLALLWLAIFAVASFNSAAQQVGATNASWKFAVSGDSRNCGDVVMPGIAAAVLQQHVEFYWHLGDFRKIYDFDEDMQHEPEHVTKPMSISDYEGKAWDDFIENQIAPFGALPVFLGIGNHELAPGRTRDDYIAEFADWLEAPALREQRLRDNPKDHRLKTYFHWVENGIDFITLDNASPDQFDHEQVKWFEQVLAKDKSDADIKTILVGMHRALPDSISAGHSMNESPEGTESGRRVYADLLKAQNDAKKRVYVLASHSHFLMDGIFNTDYWRNNGGVLPGWIVGTAGAVRYALPEKSSDARIAKTNVYGYLLATATLDGEIRFEFQRLSEKDIPQSVVDRYTSGFVHWCFAENSSAH